VPLLTISLLTVSQGSWQFARPRIFE